MSFDNTNKGVLFKEEVKKNASGPDYRGSINVDGVEMWVSGWIKTAGPNAKNPGSKFLSVSVEKKDDKYLKPKPAKDPLYDMDGDAPF